MAEVVARRPPEHTPCPSVVIDTVEGREHPPLSALVLRLLIRERLAYDRRRIMRERRHVSSIERRRCTDDQSFEAERGRSLNGQEVGLDRVGDVHSPV